MGSFANKIIMGQAIGLYGQQTRRNLDIIRAIRNAFAHAKRPISFGDDELIALVSFLVVHEKRTFGTEPDRTSLVIAGSFIRRECGLGMSAK